MPIMTIALGVAIQNEPATPSLLTGALLVVAGVFVGVFMRRARA
jgi:drug/metabolite transporter (DMT)-like permease